MRRILFALTGALLLFGLTSPPAFANEAVFSANLRGNIADQVIAGFPASRATWDIRRGRVTLVGFGERRAILVAQAKGLIIPAIGFNPSPDFLARVVCHDAAGQPSEAARTKAAPLSQSGKRDADRRGRAAGGLLRADRAHHRLDRSRRQSPRQLVRGLGLLDAVPCNPRAGVAS